MFDSLAEEAIASSQLDGASTSRAIAADMIRYGRKPRDASQRMTLNNFLAMQWIQKLAEQPLDFKRLMNLHTTLIKDTLGDSGAAGRLQTADEERVKVFDNTSQRVLFRPPSAERLGVGVNEMISIANQTSSNRPFLHPVIRAVVLHVWLAYLYPFADGNGRTARALIYWSMLRQGYPLFQFVSISRLPNEAPTQYNRAFLYTETGENDLTYFIIHQLDVIKRAVNELDVYLERKADQIREVEKPLRVGSLNHR